MNLERLQRASNADTKELNICGAVVRVRKISAQDGIALHKMMPADALNGDKLPHDPAAMTAFYTFAISKALVDDDGNLDTDSDEARLELQKLSLAHLVALSEACLEFSGLAAKVEDAKKNESGANSISSLTGCAATSESNTPTT